MNAKQLFAAVALIATGSAFAGNYQVGGEAYASFPIPSMIKTTTEAKAAPTTVAAAGISTSTTGKTRAEVIAELAQARAEGNTVGGDEYVASNPATPARVAPETVKTATSK